VCACAASRARGRASAALAGVRRVRAVARGGARGAGAGEGTGCQDAGVGTLFTRSLAALAVIAASAAGWGGVPTIGQTISAGVAAVIAAAVGLKKILNGALTPTPGSRHSG
jgi:hypothetical protein